MDVESARKHLVISGYDHPESTINFGKDKRYKTFDENDKMKKNNIDQFQSTNMKNQYSVSFKEISENCPKCDTPSVYNCNCAFSDKKCVNGHIWYTDRDGKHIMGNPHKK